MNTPPNAVPRRGHRFLALLRDAWLIVGISIALFVVLELASRGPQALRALKSRRLVRDAPNEMWARTEGVGRPFIDLLTRRYDPFRAVAFGPVVRPGITMSADGARRTVPAPAAPAAPAARSVLMLGGSVMWGFYAPDSVTIPSLVAANLAAAGFRDAAVENRAGPGYVLTQDVVTLVLQLRAGRIPRAVVVLQGINDMAAGVLAGEPGHIFREHDLAVRSVIGTTRTRHLVSALALSSHLVADILAPRLRPAGRRAPGRLACDSVAVQFIRQLELIEALGTAYGFPVLLVWQPALAATHKPLTAWERRRPLDHPYNPRYAECTRAVVAAAGDHAGRDFIEATGLFDADTATIFLDQFGHLTDRGNRRVAEVMTQWLVPALAARPR